MRRRKLQRLPQQLLQLLRWKQQQQLYIVQILRHAHRRNVCVCNTGYEMNASGDCVLISCFNTCLTCNSSQQNGCLTCKPFSTLANGFCNCNNGYWNDLTTCVSCHNTCAQCVNGNTFQPVHSLQIERSPDHQ
jgi:hypothetical protein